MKQSGRLSRARVAFQNANRRARRRETLLRSRPRSGTEILVAQLGRRNRQVVLIPCLRRKRRVVIMVPDVPQEDGTLGSLVKCSLLERSRTPRCPPRVEMTPLVAPQPRTPPALIVSPRRLVMNARRIDHQPLQQQARTLADSLRAPAFQLLEELLMAEDRVPGRAVSNRNNLSCTDMALNCLL